MRAMRVIALEEHFWTPAVADAIGALRNPDTTASQSPLAANLEDLGEGRLAAMEAAGIDLQVISHTTPGVQHLEDAETAVESRARPTTNARAPSPSTPIASPPSPRSPRPTRAPRRTSSSARSASSA